MTWVRTILVDILALFVDDRGFAASVVCLLLLAWTLSLLIQPHTGWSGVLLFATLACLLIESTVRRARRP